MFSPYRSCFVLSLAYLAVPLPPIDLTARLFYYALWWNELRTEGYGLWLAGASRADIWWPAHQLSARGSTHIRSFIYITWVALNLSFTSISSFLFPCITHPALPIDQSTSLSCLPHAHLRPVTSSSISQYAVRRPYSLYYAGLRSVALEV
jgi:hypothetical protein